MAKAQKEQLPQIDPRRELDFYNIKENRLKVFERDKYLCHYCKKQLTRFSATLDHIQPVSKGGDNSYDNLVTACLLHNSQRNAQPIMDYLTRKQ
jgi:5-methylcytosine-specific restriction endonuclease McrA